ncbi:hypothetical protein NGB36_10105 [Streptomyces sp. RB6PN25]|uniref:Uncharacterized protein n=1 Tax=Streptomyces humicola TaxID=2953240 RepID=A0ABT1PTD9_9ACTN|nr:hypothetical protein [Streptomyces humicola]MCQ4080943.1 hypothetical protein [Streptomyces humicola]
MQASDDLEGAREAIAALSEVTDVLVAMHPAEDTLHASANLAGDGFVHSNPSDVHVHREVSVA